MYAAGRDPYCYPGTMRDLKPKAVLRAFVASFKGDERPLRNIIERAISSR
jgi:hypothetical protein